MGRATEHPVLQNNNFQLLSGLSGHGCEFVVHLWSCPVFCTPQLVLSSMFLVLKSFFKGEKLALSAIQTDGERVV